MCTYFQVINPAQFLSADTTSEWFDRWKVTKDFQNPDEIEFYLDTELPESG